MNYKQEAPAGEDAIGCLYPGNFFAKHCNTKNAHEYKFRHPIAIGPA